MCIAGSIFDVCGISYIYSLLKSPFISPFRLKKTRTMRLFPEVYQVIEKCDPIDRIILPRRFSRNAEPVFQRFTTQYASRSHRLLSSLECLEREVRACSPSETKISRRKEWSDEKLPCSGLWKWLDTTVYQSPRYAVPDMGRFAVLEKLQGKLLYAT